MENKNLKKILCVLIFCTFVYLSDYWYKPVDRIIFHKNYQSLLKTKRIWGEDPFSKSKFINGNRSERFRMVYNLISQKSLINLQMKDVPSLLGEADGIYLEESTVLRYLVYYRKNETGIEYCNLEIVPLDYKNDHTTVEDVLIDCN